MPEVLEIRGLESVNRLITSLPEAARDERLLDGIVAIMINRTRNRFLREVAPDEIPWPPSRGGEIRKSGGWTYSGGYLYSGGGTLFLTGRLFHSIQPFRPGPMKRGIGTDVPYARTHQLGLGPHVVREFLGISETDRQVIDLLINRHLNDWLDRQRLI